MFTEQAGLFDTTLTSLIHLGAFNDQRETL